MEHRGDGTVAEKAGGEGHLQRQPVLASADMWCVSSVCGTRLVLVFRGEDVGFGNAQGLAGAVYVKLQFTCDVLYYLVGLLTRQKKKKRGSVQWAFLFSSWYVVCCVLGCCHVYPSDVLDIL